MPKKVTLEKLKALEVESYQDRNGFTCWRYQKVPKDLVPTKADIGKLVILAREPGTRDYFKNYRIRDVVLMKDETIVELRGENGFASRRISDVVLSNKNKTKEEELVAEHKSKDDDR